MTGNDLDQIFQTVNKALTSVFEWLCANKLTFNLRQASHIVFHPRQKLNYNVHPRTSLAGQHKEQAFCVNMIFRVIDQSFLA